MPAQVPTPRAAPTHALTSSISLPNRVTLSPAPIYRHKQLAAPPVASTYNAHTNKGSRYDLARDRCINTPVIDVCRPWRRILYACTPTTINIEPLDVIVTSSHRERTCLAGCGHSKQAISCAVNQYNCTDRPERTRRHPTANPGPSHLTRATSSCQRIPSLVVGLLNKNFVILTDSCYFLDWHTI